MIKVIVNGKLHNYEQNLKPKVMRTDKRVRSKWSNERFNENLHYLDFNGTIIFIPEEYISEFKNGCKYDVLSSSYGIIKRKGLLYLSKHNVKETFIIIISKYSNGLAVKDTVNLINLKNDKQAKSRFYTKTKSWPMVPQIEERRFLNYISVIYKNPKMLHLHSCGQLIEASYINYNSVTKRVEIQKLNNNAHTEHLKQIMNMRKSLFESRLTKRK